jgi:hypothetical protein
MPLKISLGDWREARDLLAVVRHLLEDTDAFVLNIDKLTYVSNLSTILTVDRAALDLTRQAETEQWICTAKPDASLGSGESRRHRLQQ